MEAQVSPALVVVVLIVVAAILVGLYFIIFVPTQPHQTAIMVPRVDAAAVNPPAPPPSASKPETKPASPKQSAASGEVERSLQSARNGKKKPRVAPRKGSVNPLQPPLGAS